MHECERHSAYGTDRSELGTGRGFLSRRYAARVPELPEVETIRRQLADLIVGATITDVWATPSPKFAAARATIGATVTDVTRRGKYLVCPIADGRELIVHLGMTGTIEITSDPPVDARWIRAQWHLDDARTITYRDQRQFGRIAVVAAGDYATLPTLAALGPEPLSEQFTGTHLYQALRTSRRAVKTQLLGQRVVAGVGNIYADEALWRAEISPSTSRVGPARAAALATEIKTVLNAAITHGGTRLRDYRSVHGDTGQHQFHLDCYGRSGEPCNRCQTPLAHRVLDGRGTTWCPRCQRR